MNPTVGRMVHYVSYGTPGGEYPSVCRAAVVTEVILAPDCGTCEDGNCEDKLALAVLNPTGMFFNEKVGYWGSRCSEESLKGGTWHWPERC